MTENYYYRTENYKPDHSTCGSQIYNYDFDGYVSISDMAERIISDWKFDEERRKDALNRDRNKNYKKGVMSYMNFANNNENCIEFLNNQHSITVSFCMQKWINKVKKLKEEHPDDVKILAENEDGSICARLPIKYLKISAPRKVSDEQRQAASERFKKLREENKL